MVAAVGNVWFDMAVIWVSVALSSIAAVVSLLAARHAMPEFRATFAASGVLASIYTGAYIWLAFNFERSKEWSALLRPVALLAWVVAWILPPMVSMRLWAKLRASAKKGV